MTLITYRCKSVCQSYDKIYTVIKLIPISRPTRSRPPHGAGPHHKSKPESARTFRKHRSRRPNLHQPRPSSSALTSFPCPKNRTCWPYKDIPDLSANHAQFPRCLFSLINWPKIRHGKNTPLLMRHSCLQSMGCFSLIYCCFHS